jgi:alpha-glucosidase
MLMAQGTFEGILASNPEKRPFVLTRAGFLGSHRYAATWTGDNNATWLDLEQSIPMIINLGLSGQPFSGPDIGGFNGNGPNNTPTSRGEHFARWMGIGALFPFSRGHTAKGNIDKEPWSFGPEVEATCRIALERRYRLLPYFYTLFHEASVTGLPVMRPVFFADPKDPALRGEDDTFLLGSGLLVVPSLMPDHSRVAILPQGDWREFSLVEGDQNDPNQPELRAAPGAIIPVGPVQQFTDEKALDPLTLIVNLDSAGQASGTLYEDAGDGFAFQKGQFRLTTFAAKREGNAVTVRVAKTEGQLALPARNIAVRLLTDAGEVTAQGKDGDTIRLTVK